MHLTAKKSGVISTAVALSLSLLSFKRIRPTNAMSLTEGLKLTGGRESEATIAGVTFAPGPPRPDRV